MMSDVHEAQLLSLLAQQAESSELEYIEDCDLDERRDTVELATEVGAMAARGGYIVIGVDNHGQPTGRLDARKTALFDDSILQDKLGRYLPPSVSLRSGRHQVKGSFVVAVYVGRHPDGAVVFVNEGTFETGRRSITAFRPGDIFVRHGSKSERPTQADIHRLVVDAIAREETWLGQIQRVEAAVAEIGAIAEREAKTSSDGRVAGYGLVTRLPAARRRLAAALAVLEHVEGPDLPQARELAGASIYIFYNQFVGAVFAATDEIARVLEARLAEAG
jgi:hypothetical protein